jgi:hypothetical protein
MPRKREGDPQKRVHIWIFESDWEELRQLYADNVGPSKFVRLVVRQTLRKVKEKTNGRQQPISTASIDAELADIENSESTQ